MSYTCISATDERPEPPAGFMAAREFTDRLQGTPAAPALAVGGAGYNLIVNRDIPITWEFKLRSTGAVVNKPWTYLRIEFADDLDFSTVAVASHEFAIVNAGLENEYFAGVFPEDEINNLLMGNWYLARLLASDNTTLSYCPFYILGGV